jgi:hypothetical protein
MADVLTGKGFLVTTSLAAGLTAGASEIITVIGLSVANVHATVDSWVTVDVNRDGGVDSELGHQVNIPVNDSLDMLNGGKIVLNNSDTLDFIAENASSIEASISYLVQT